MFSAVPMRRLQAVVLARDERAVLRGLGPLGAVHLARTDAEATLSSPPDHLEAIARCDRLLARCDELAIPYAAGTSATLDLAEAEVHLRQWETRVADLRQRRQAALQRRDEAAETSARAAPYRALALPLDQLGTMEFLHFVTGRLPTRDLAALQAAIGADVELLPLAAQGDWQPIVALCPRDRRPALEAALLQTGFRPETLSALPVRQLEQSQTDVAQLDAEWESQRRDAAPVLAAVEQGAQTERCLLEAEQQFPRTAATVLITGWVPAAESGAVESRLRELTGGRCVIEWREAEAMPEEEVPVLLRRRGGCAPLPCWSKPSACHGTGKSNRPCSWRSATC